jgi:hypothetical protein
MPISMYVLYNANKICLYGTNILVYVFTAMHYYSSPIFIRGENLNITFLLVYIDYSPLENVATIINFKDRQIRLYSKEFKQGTIK